MDLLETGHTENTQNACGRRERLLRRVVVHCAAPERHAVGGHVGSWKPPASSCVPVTRHVGLAVKAVAGGHLSTAAFGNAHEAVQKSAARHQLQATEREAHVAAARHVERRVLFELLESPLGFDSRSRRSVRCHDVDDFHDDCAVRFPAEIVDGVGGLTHETSLRFAETGPVIEYETLTLRRVRARPPNASSRDQRTRAGGRAVAEHSIHADSFGWSSKSTCSIDSETLTFFDVLS